MLKSHKEDVNKTIDEIQIMRRNGEKLIGGLGVDDPFAIYYHNCLPNIGESVDTIHQKLLSLWEQEI